MRVAIDGRALTGRFTGDRTYWRNLICALSQLDAGVEYVVYSRTAIPRDDLPASFANRVVSSASDRLWTVTALPRALRQDRADLLHVQYTAPPAALCPCPVVTTVHDISFRLYPKWFPARHRLLLNSTVPPSMRAAARVITVSESSRRDIVRVYRLPEWKVRAIPHGLPSGFAAPAADALRLREAAIARIQSAYGIRGPFLLAVGVLQPRKNLDTLAQGFGLARSRFGLKHQLVLVGKPGWATGQEKLRRAAARYGGTDAARAVMFTGYVPDPDLPMFYRACSAFAYPSLYEGFGLPPLEAMACGAPVLVSDAPPMPEVAGDAALVVGAMDVEGWARALARVTGSHELRDELRRRGPVRAGRFSWSDSAQKTVDVYKEALTGAACGA